eukprot:TRINITY_DN3516_c0_g2_i1.p1 TRINITY_DN3516_c0_g2~~TRINITY_DN3516_c0_g2_i1.p1  ORF type:complete len:437 (+),score=103.79 TRINITY_DN3516_c0_g2_i1:65-1312(+)
MAGRSVMWSFAAAGVLLSLASASGAAPRPVPQFDIDLDAAPEQRFVEVVKHFNSTLQNFYETIFVKEPLVRALVWGLMKKRGPEADPEFAAEIRGVAQAAGIPETAIQTVQFLYELQTLMVPIDNITLPWHGPGCTGIVAKSKSDGMVYHARNLDFSPKFFMQNLTYVGIFKSGGKEVFRAQMVAGWNSVATGMKKGANGFTVEVNTRFPDHKGGDSEMLHNLLKEKRMPNGWVLRKILQNAKDYEEAVQLASTEKMIATMFVIMAGVKKGTILSRAPDGIVYKMTLGEPNYMCRDDYIIQTNFDFYWHDVKEFFDPTTRKGMGHSRRKAAQKILNATSDITPEILYSTITDYDVQAKDTMFQAIMNVETGLWNVSLPSLTEDETVRSLVPALTAQLKAAAALVPGDSGIKTVYV